MADPRAILLGSVDWTGGGAGFGGFSAIDLGPDGVTFIAVSDSAVFYSGRLVRDHRGVVIAVRAGMPIRPLSRRGEPLQEEMDDAEGVALAPGGDFFVSYELRNRIARYEAGRRAPVSEVWPDAFRSLVYNKGIEALAIDADGRLFAIPEVPPEGRDLPVYRLDGEDATKILELDRDGTWSPTGADFGPDGRLYLLERDFWPLLGFSSRVRRIALDGDAVTSDEVIWQSDPGRHDNLEGIAAWQDGAGAIRLTMISDDNFIPVQRTEIVDLLVMN